MGRVLVERHRWAQELVIQTDQWLQDRLAQPISHVLYRSLEKAVNSAELAQWQQDLAKTEVAQPALCLASVLWSRYLEQLGIKPLAVGGHSLGELTAFHTAGAFDVETLLRLAAIRGQAMSGSGSSDRAGAMASLGCSELVTTSLLQSVQSDVVVANMNSHQQTVISGDRSSVETVVQLAAAQNIQTHLLPVSHAFHSPQVAAAADYLRDTAPVPETLSSLPIALFSSVRDAQVHLGINLREHFAMQVTSQVDFISLVKAMSPQCDLLIEVGSGRVLSGLANAITNGETPCLPVESKSGSDRDLNQVLATFFVQGGEINWDALYENRLVRPFIPASQRQFIENPCERPFQVPIATNPSSANVQVPQQLSQNGHQDSFNPMVAPPSDFDWTETLSNYFVQRGAFLAQVIRADLQTLPHLNDRNLTNYSSAIHSAQTTNGGMNEKAIDVPPQAPLVPAESGAIAELLLGLVEERTGFPKTTLTLNLRLLDDLNLDSIKAADLIATVAKRLGVGGKLDPSMLANATLADVVTTLQAAQPQTVSTPTIEAATDSGTNPINRSSWVRHFAIEFVPQALPANPSENWALATVLILADTVDSAVVQALQNHLSGLGAQVKSISYQQFTAKENGWNSFSHYLAILPQSNTSAALPLPQMMARLRSIVTPKSQPDACIAYVQFGGGNFGRNGKTHPASSCAAAFARTLHLERPELRVRVIDLASELAPDRVADLAIAELSGTEAIATVGYDANQVRRVPQARVQQPAQYRQRFSQGDANDKRSLGWSDQDVVLVTGGAKGITAECALAFAQAHGVKMALVGRSSAATDAEVRQTLARCQAAGLTCRYYSCDIVDGDAIASLIKTISAELGSITAVIHGAGLNQPRLLEQASLEAAQAEVSPKLLGAHNLLQALDPTALRMFVAFSSIIAVTGMPGNAWYGFANEALDISLCCFQQAHPSIQVLSIAYSIWDEVGMGARMGSVKTLKRMGISAIPVQEGVSRFLRLMEADPGTTQVLIAARLAGLDTWPPTPLPDATNLRFVEQVRYVEPGVELVARAHLSLERDRYIQDHIWRGYYLFPTVFGLEAMAQAVAYVTGNLKPAIARIEDISLQRPVVVDPTQGVEIEIYAEVMEASGNGEQQICVSIRTEQTDFSIDHFAAIVVLGKLASGELMPGAQTVQSDPVLADKALEINPQVDLYEGLLFQGKRFQQMGAIFALTSNTAVFQSNVQPNTELGIDSFSTELGQCLLLGDAYFRDVLLQSVQLTIPQNICLPIHIAKIEWFENSALEQEASDRGRIVTAQLLQQDGREYDAEVIATNEQGYITERISGYRLRILEEHPENPTAEQLAFPETRDRHQLQAVLGTTFQQLGIIPPAIALGYAPNLQAKPRDQRLQHEQLIVERALRDQLGLSSSEALDFGIRSQPSGKPELTGSVASFDVSLSHCDRYCLCVVGASPQGCDIEAIIPRDQDDWVALLSDAHSPIIDELVQQGDTRDRAAMRIWSALEAVRKAYSGANPEFSILKKQGDSVLLHASMPAGDCGVVTVPIRLTRPPERMIAIVVPLTQARASAPVTELDHCDRHFSGYTSDGPQGQPVYQQRFQVSFKESGSISRRIYFSQYFRWIGKIRELPMESIASQVLSDFFSGDWGMVTNAVSLRVLGEATAYDVLQARAWVGDVTGSSFTTYIEFCKVLPDGSLERLAITEVRATWVQLKSYGVPSPMPFPAYLAEYLEQFAPRQSALLDLTQPKILNLPPLPTTLTQLDLGAIVYQAPLHQSRSGMLLRSEVFQTTLEESNLVGNVYYGNYFIWQGRILDLFLYSVAPEYLRVSNPIGEMLCLYSRMDYLREAMPFDRIKTQLYVRSVSECGATFNFEFFREQFDGSLEKLHIGQQEVVWVERRADGSPVAAPLPSSVMQALVDCSISSPGMNSIRY